MNTKIQRKTHGDKSWEAKTYEDITINDKPAQIFGTTYKNFNGNLVSTISVAWIMDDRCTRHTIFEDYNRTVCVTHPKRITGKAVEDQHYEQIRLKWAQHMADAYTFYAAKGQ